MNVVKVNITFRTIKDTSEFNQLTQFLTQDVIKHGGSAGQVVSMHGKLTKVIVCKVPWGTLIINQEVTRLEALAWIWQPVE